MHRPRNLTHDGGAIGDRRQGRCWPAHHRGARRASHLGRRGELDVGRCNDLTMDSSDGIVPRIGTDYAE